MNDDDDDEKRLIFGGSVQFDNCFNYPKILPTLLIGNKFTNRLSLD